MQIFNTRKCLSPDLIDQNLQQEITCFVQKCFGDETLIVSINLLTEPSRRNQIMRLNLKNLTNQVPSSVILKQSIFKESIENQSQTLGRFARDWAGLEFLNNLGCDITPKFYGGHQKHQFILLEDLGQEHLSLVDSLIGHNQEQAMQSLTRYMQSLGKFHGFTFGCVSSHEEILRRVNPVIAD
ncbi:MAG: hypothetical protein ACRYGR_05290 [Janthinobacterium lividum]